MAVVEQYEGKVLSECTWGIDWASQREVERRVQYDAMYEYYKAMDQQHQQELQRIETKLRRFQETLADEKKALKQIKKSLVAAGWTIDQVGDNTRREAASFYRTALRAECSEPQKLPRLQGRGSGFTRQLAALRRDIDESRQVFSRASAAACSGEHRSPRPRISVPHVDAHSGRDTSTYSSTKTDRTHYSHLHSLRPLLIVFGVLAFTFFYQWLFN